MTLIGICGAGGFGREVMPIAQQLLPMRRDTETVFVETMPSAETINGLRVISEDAFLSGHGERLFNVAIANSQIRARVAQRCIDGGARPINLFADHSVVYTGNDIGEGAILCAFSTITSNAKIGRFFHANLYSYVLHNCIIGDFVTFGPGAKCNGNVRIGDHAYIGAGAIIRNGTPELPLRIGKGAVVGMGAVVTKDVPEGATVIGNPAKAFERQH